MITVLFVDDDQQELETQQQFLRSQRPEWTSVFVHGGAAGMAELASRQFDVIVTNLRMPNVDGAMLLRHAAERSPSTVRIAVAAQADMGALLRNVRFAHIFLTKPCAGTTIVASLDRVAKLHSLLADDALRSLVGGVASLPTVPRVYTALERAVLAPDVNTDAVARIISQDIALSAKLLQLVNSAFFGLPRASTRIEHAIHFLGFTVLRALVLSHEIAEVFSGGETSGFSLETHEAHALLVASIARRLVRDRARADEAYIAAILHDVGKMLLASRTPEQFGERARTAAEREVPLHVVEQETIGVTHAEVGAYLLGLWGIPFTITEAVASHHAPGNVPAATVADEVLVVVHVANALAHEFSEGRAAPDARLDMEFLTRVGADIHLPTWRTLAAEEFERVQRDRGVVAAAVSPLAASQAVLAS